MFKYKFLLFFIITGLFYSGICFAAFDETGMGSARIIGMGGAYTAVENEGEGILMNPSSVFNISKGSVTLMYSPMYIGLNDGSFNNGYMNVVYKFEDIGIFSINYLFLNTSTQLVSNLYDESSLILTYSRPIIPDLYAGIRLNYYKWQGATQTDPNGITQSLTSSALSFGINAFYNKSKDFKVGLAINNINQPKINDTSIEDNYTERQDIEIRPGLSFNITDILIALDLRYMDSNVDINLGSEYWFLNKNNEQFIGIRIGINLPDLGNGINATAGFSIFLMEGLSIDYGFLIPLTTITHIWGEHKFSLTYKF